MDNLKKMYKNECQLISNRAGAMWKIGVIVGSVLFSLTYFITYNEIKYAGFYVVLAFFVIFAVWFYICVIVYDIELRKKVKRVYSNLNIKGKKKHLKYEEKLNEYQKNIMSKYTRRNRLNKLGKLNIIINELQQELTKKKILEIYL